MVPRVLKRSVYEAASYEAWNAFVNLLAMEPLEALTEIQRHAHLAFWYDSELQNGGHLQYFENCAIQYVDSAQRLDATLRGLEIIGAGCQRAVLSRAAKRWNQHPRHRIPTVEEYVATALEGEFDDLDKAYYECQPEMTQLLEAYLNSHFDAFIELT